MRLRNPIIVLVVLLGILCRPNAIAWAQSASAAPAEPAGVEYFEKNVRPILAQYCFGCHSHAAQKSRGNLFLDSRQAVMHGGQRGAAIVAGDPNNSLLLSAIRYMKPDLQMPPDGKMSDKAIAALTEWVKMGAPWPQEDAKRFGFNGTVLTGANAAREKAKRLHWAWQPVRNPAPPAVKRKDWAKNPIDRFILSKLEEKGLAPAPPADRRSLIRRAYYDLIGLPPTPEEVAAFLADNSPRAWEKVVDRLLASPHFGERWGRFWLDIARYGEDQAHTTSALSQGFRYRDWVAHALNSDMPYDRFIKAQIAADLMPASDWKENLPALGFFAIGPVYYVDAFDAFATQKMYDEYDDRIDTLARGFLGVTAACARCHDHKFDPISQKDYYGLAGVFASSTYIEVPLASLDTSAKDFKPGRLVNRNDLINAKTTEYDRFANDQVRRLREELMPQIARYLTAAWKLHNRRKVDPKVTAEQVAQAEGVQGVVLERWAQYLAKSDDKARPYLAAWRQMLQQEDPKTDLTTSSQTQEAVRKAAEDYQTYILNLNRRRTALNAPRAATAASSTGAGGQNIGTTPLEKPVPLDKSEVAALDEIVGDEGVLTIPKDRLEGLLTGDNKARFLAAKSEMERMRAEPFVHALTEGSKIGNVRVLVRGNPKQPGEEAPRHFLSILAGENAPVFTQGSGRLELANAIADKSNPLTARVMVNRVWQHHFGRGIVRTASNFGILGEPPTHPALLDYLATRFMAQGWSLKSLHREIMCSATYQMSSKIDRHNNLIDPDDRLVWRMRRRPLEVEAWRDGMLAVSGSLDTTQGGPSVSLASPDNHRRTFYAAISRHDLDSMLRLFDFPDPNVTADARMTTTVPLQQLFFLNSEFMIQQAKSFAARVTANPDEPDALRIRRAFQLAYSRPPTDRELNLGLAYLHLPQSGARTAADTAGGNGPRFNSLSDANTVRLSRWEQYAQALLSANEFMYVD